MGQEYGGCATWETRGRGCKSLQPARFVAPPKGHTEMRDELDWESGVRERILTARPAVYRAGLEISVME